MATNWGQVGGAASDIFGGVGQLVAAGGYREAAGFASQNAALTARMTDIEVQQAERQAFKVIGGMEADIASAGFALSGTALDLMADSARAASLDKQLIANRGLIEQNAYLAQAAQYDSMATSSTMSGIGGVVSGIAGLAMLSDVRVKTDVKTIDHDSHGRRWVSFRYVWDEPMTVRRGVIAQEVLKSDPQAVGIEPITGFYTVDYSKLKGGQRAEH